MGVALVSAEQPAQITIKDEFWMRPHLCVRDVAASIAYYCERLGFTLAWAHGDDPQIIAQVSRNGLDIILDCGSVLPRAATPSVLGMSLHQPENLGALYRGFKERGAKIAATPFEVIWQAGVYQFDVEDLDGNVLMFCGSKPEE